MGSFYYNLDMRLYYLGYNKNYKPKKKNSEAIKEKKLSSVQ